MHDTIGNANKIILSHFAYNQIVHRTLAALFTAFLSIATLAALNDRPTMHDLVNWIDSEALLLIFSMMTIVSILMETGIFDYIAVYTFQVAMPIDSRLFFFSISFMV